MNTKPKHAHKHTSIGRHEERKNPLLYNFASNKQYNVFLWLGLFPRFPTHIRKKINLSRDFDRIYFATLCCIQREPNIFSLVVFP